MTTDQGDSGVRSLVRGRAAGVAASAVTALVAFLAGGVVIVATTGKAPWGVYKAIFEGAGLNWLLPWVSGADRVNAAFNLQQTLLVATPLLLTGLAVAVGFRCGCSTSAPRASTSAGQIVAVVVGSSWAGLFGPVHIVVAIVVAALAGAALGRASPGFCAAAFGAHEVITTIMLNWIALWVGQLPVRLRRAAPGPGQVNPISSDVVPSARLHVWWGDPLLQGLHVGIFVALAALVVYWLLLGRTTLGFEIRTVGANAEAARYAGISVGRSTVVAMAHLRALRRAWREHSTSSAGSSTSPRSDIQASTIGFTGIAVALLGRNSAIGILFASLLFAALSVGTSTRQLDPTIFDPALAGNLTLIIQGLIILLIGADVLRADAVAPAAGGGRDGSSGGPGGAGARSR